MGPFDVEFGKQSQNLWQVFKRLLIKMETNSLIRLLRLARGVAITANNATTGNFTYIAPDTPGLDNFTFSVEDDKGAVSNISMVILNVVQNPQPTARTICERPFDSTLTTTALSVDNHTGTGSNITSNQ